jgi:hypothetical protein
MAKTALDQFVDGLLEEETPTPARQSEVDRSLWPCPRCGTPAEIEDVCPSLDGAQLLTLWHCRPCQTWGVTPSALREPPVWVSKVVQ